MGVCLCKDKVENESSEDLTYESNLRCNTNERLSERVDELVKETLDVIASIVDDDPETPSSMVILHNITDRPKGWLCLVKSLIRVIPLDHPMGASVITLLLDDSPLPSKDSVIEVAEMIKTDTTTTIPCERNFCVILGCLAEKLAGPCSIAILTDATLNYLFKNITEETPKDVMLFSLIALGKLFFSLTHSH
jgi:RING finger and SPRY domain-containing protein 1